MPTPHSTFDAEECSRVRLTKGEPGSGQVFSAPFPKPSRRFNRCSSRTLRQFLAHFAVKSFFPQSYAAPLLFLARRHVFFRSGGAFAKKELIQLLYDHFLIFPPRRVQAVFVEQHLAVLGPHVPRVLG